MAGKTGNQWETFGAFAQDLNREKTSNFPNYFMMNDATASPVTSPLSLTTGVTTINVPAAAVSMTITNSGGTNSILVSDKANASQTYAIGPNNQSITLPVTRTTQVYLASSASTTTAQFYFSLI